MFKSKVIEYSRRGQLFLEKFLNGVAMYRLVLYVLMSFVAVAFIYSFFGSFGLVPFTPTTMLISLVVILGVSWVTNILFAYVFKVSTNVESVYITALILFCVVTPPQMGDFMAYLSLAGWASVWAVASKFMVAIKRKHIFNPVAFALVLTALTLHQSASWWIGRGDMLPFVLVGGLLIVMKIRRFDMVISFGVSALITIGTIALLNGSDVVSTLATTFSDTAFLFFAFIMLTEPLTTPPTSRLRILYGVLVGFLFAPQLHFGSFYSTPELALVVGNIFSYAVSPKQKYILKFKERIEVAKNTFDYIFTSNIKILFRSGQYMEWTLAHPHPDTRGNRRYFTLASAPTENTVCIGMRHYAQSSSFKMKLQEMVVGDEIIAAQGAGDFVLPTQKNEKLAFIAGGIGITPFRSMIQYMLDTKEKRDAILLYTNRNAEDIAYKDIFDKAQNELGLKTSYFVTDPNEKAINGFFQTERVTAEQIKKEVPDYMERKFYISGRNEMVSGIKSMLKSLGVRPRNIKTDYFSGL